MNRVVSSSPENFWSAVRGESVSPDAWPGVIERARKDGILGYLAHLHDDLPGRAEIRKLHAAAHLAQLNLLRNVRALMTPQGIPWAVLKGVAIAYWLYPENPPSRTAGDCDLLVLPEHRPRIEALLADEGFQQSRDHRELFSGPGGQVDLHVALINRERIPSRDAAVNDVDWTRETQMLDTPEGAIPVLGDKLWSQYLGLHLIHHHGIIGSKWLIDLSRVPNPDQIAALGRNGQLAVNLTDHLMRQKPFRPRTRLDRAVTRAAWTGEDVRGIRFLLTLRDIPRNRDRMRFLREAIFPDRRVLRSAAMKSGGAPVRTHLLDLARTARALLR